MVELDADSYVDKIAIGAGCCSGLNSWRNEPLRDRRLAER